MKENPNIYRKRMIPEECILLKDDILLEVTDDVIVTKWNTLKPKRELHHGYSCYFLKQGFKVSKFYRADNTLMYWYCDIVDYDYNEETNTLVAADLLADVIIYPDGFVKVVDLDELALAVEKKICELFLRLETDIFLSCIRIIPLRYFVIFPRLTIDCLLTQKNISFESSCSNSDKEQSFLNILSISLPDTANSE